MRLTMNYFLNVAIQAIKWYLGTGAANTLIDSIISLISDERTGEEKRAYVVEMGRSQLDLVDKEFGIKALIELVLAKYLTKTSA